MRRFLSRPLGLLCLLLVAALASVVAHAKERALALELSLPPPVTPIPSSGGETSFRTCTAPPALSASVASLADPPCDEAVGSATKKVSPPIPVFKVKKTAPSKRAKPSRSKSPRAKPARSKAPPVKRPPPPDRFSRYIQRRGVDRYDVDGDFFDAQLADVEGLKRQGGASMKSRGVRVTSVADDGVFNSLGVRPNDLITRVNGSRVDSAFKLFLLYEGLRTTERITLRIEREGKARTLRYRILR